MSECAHTHTMLYCNVANKEIHTCSATKVTGFFYWFILVLS